MKNFFKKIKSYGFWVSLSSALVLLSTSLGKAFGFEIENKIIEDIVMAVAGVLAVFGIVSMNTNTNDGDTKPSEEESSNDLEQSNMQNEKFVEEKEDLPFEEENLDKK